ncbi:MAG: hypothetical protein IJ899_22465 [Blautia sp.]|nr:hypothetical protein [Blautia sp.]
MARPKKDGIYLNIKLDKDLYHRLERVSEAAGQTKTLIAERALTAYMDKYEGEQEIIRKIEDGRAELVEKDGAHND